MSGCCVPLSIFLNVWITDTAAMEIGKRWGKHKLAPNISPNKTVEGSIAGTLAAVILVSVYAVLVLGINIGIAIIMTLIASVLGQVGDLLESALKRWAGVKDSGKILPGHGGILDRFDSMLLSAPFVYIILLIIS